MVRDLDYDKFKRIIYKRLDFGIKRPTFDIEGNFNGFTAPSFIYFINNHFIVCLLLLKI
jgi:hypothetical protein